MTNLPVAYMTLSKNGKDARNAVINAIEQSYKNQLNKIYLIHQNPLHQKFICSDGIEVIHLLREGKWPLLFAQKIQTFLQYVKEPITIVWDEDDRFKSNYLEQALTDLGNLDAVVNWHNVVVDGTGFYFKKHRECWGTLVIKTDVLKRCFNAVVSMNPGMVDPGNGWVLDTELRKYIVANTRVGIHKGIRYFFQVKGASTAGRRKGVILIDG